MMGTLLASPARRRDLPLMWQQAIHDWSAYLSVIGRAERTIHAYRRTFVNFLADTMLDPFEVSQDDIVGYVAAFAASGAMRGTVLRALRSFYSWAEDRGHANPAKRLKVKNPKYGPAPHLDDEARTRHVVALAWREPRRAWVYLLLYATGGRIGSVCAARASDVRNDRLYFRVAKNDDPYSVPLGRLGREAVAELSRWSPPSRRHKSNGTLVGVSEVRVRQWFDQAARDTGIAVWPHLLRHTFAQEIASRLKTVEDQRVWMSLMNHKDLSQFPRYVEARQERAEEVVEAL